MVVRTLSSGCTSRAALLCSAGTAWAREWPTHPANAHHHELSCRHSSMSWIANRETSHGHARIPRER